MLFFYVPEQYLEKVSWIMYIPFRGVFENII